MEWNFKKMMIRTGTRKAEKCVFSRIRERSRDWMEFQLKSTNFFTILV